MAKRVLGASTPNHLLHKVGLDKRSHLCAVNDAGQQFDVEA